MDTGKRLITASGLEKFKEELFDLKVNQRKEVAQKIKEAREQGDLSENAEYDAAKEEQAEIEARISHLEAVLKNVDVIDEDEIGTDVVNVGTKVKLYDVEFEEELTYQMVGSSESNLLENKVSNESPVGKALMGKKVGETVKVPVGGSEISFKILEIGK